MDKARIGGEPENEPKKRWANDALCSELISMQVRDMAIRHAQTIQSDLGKPVTQDALTQAEFVDRVHTARMREIVACHGWPGHALVGLEGSAAALLLVLHADRDVRFQKQCLDLLHRAVAIGDALASQTAFLTDRICINEGRPQWYGTQMKIHDGTWVIADIRNAVEVNQRRTAVGLPLLRSLPKPENPPDGCS